MDGRMVKLEIWFDRKAYYRLPRCGRLEAAGNRRTLEGLRPYTYFTITCDWYMQVLQYEKRNCCTVRYYIVRDGDDYYLILYSSGCSSHPGILDYQSLEREKVEEILQASRRGSQPKIR
ncbi:MAG: hypothetical protein ACTSWP_04780 [Candidatus Freyarchaeota archaeon]